MPKILVNVSEAQKGVWVREAHGELVSLSEWVRRACDARAGLGAGAGESPKVAPALAPSPSPGDDTVTPGTKAGLVSSQGSFKPDFKK